MAPIVGVLFREIRGRSRAIETEGIEVDLMGVTTDGAGWFNLL